MQTVNVRQLKSNPSVALREAENDVVVVMNRDHPTAVLVGLEQLAGKVDLGSVRLALALSLFKQRTMSLGSAAKLAGKSVAEMISVLSATGIAVVDYPARELDEELAHSARFERPAL